MAARHSALVLGAITLIACGAANAADLLPPVQTQWKVDPPFEDDKDHPRQELSGAACTTRKPPFTSCLIVNDETKYAQFFSITDTTIKPDKVMRLRAKDAAGDPDGEGAAYDDGFFYITGSHGRARKNPNKSSVPSYVVFRIAVDKATGRPKTISKDEVVGVEETTRVHDAIHDSKDLLPYFNAPLDPKGANIEGIAVKNGRIYLGFRGPSVDDGDAFILSVDADHVFIEKKKDADLDAKTHRVKLGPKTGIRDMAAVDGGILILSGPVIDQPVVDQTVIPSVFFWNEQTGDLRRLAQLQIPDDLKEFKAETLLILRDEKDQPYRALVMFDGIDDGKPTEYHIPR
jgi:hypothetical protein